MSLGSGAEIRRRVADLGLCGLVLPAAGNYSVRQVSPDAEIGTRRADLGLGGEGKPGPEIRIGITEMRHGVTDLGLAGPGKRRGFAGARGPRLAVQS
jgi:hypothetical protein